MTELKYTEYNASPGSTHERLLELVGDARRVLDVGCATGYFAERLCERGCTVTGIEIDPIAADRARAHCAEVVVADVDGAELSDIVTGPFDVVVFGDVLEHLRDPLGPLASSLGLLADDGSVVASVPNIAHISVRLALLAGDFTYRATGLLDRTHLRFFTPETFDDLLEEAGLIRTRRFRQRVDAGAAEIPLPPGIPAELVDLAVADPEATTYQVIVQAVPKAAAPASALGPFRAAIEASEAEARAAEARSADLGDTLTAIRAHAEKVEQELAAVNERFSAELGVLGDRADALLLENEVLAEEADDLAGRLGLAEAAIADTFDPSLQRQIDAMTATRLWRLGSTYWRARDRVRGRSR